MRHLLVRRFIAVVVTSSALAALSLASAGCDAVAEQESSYTHRHEKAAELVGKADAATKVELETKLKAIDAEYAALPADKGKRGDPLGKLNQKINALVDEYQPKIEGQAKAGADKALSDGIKMLAGHWVGGGIDLTIDEGGGVAYEKKSGSSSKSFSGKMVKVGPDSFEAGALGINTTFKLDEKPHDAAGKTVMKVDGVEVTRQ